MTAPGRLVVSAIPGPIPGEYDAVCEVLYGATCTGTDLHIIDGVFPWSSPFPTVLGHESIGRVIRVGDEVRSFALGDLITRVGALPTADSGLTATWGGFAELAIARDHAAMAADGLPEQAWSDHRINQVVPAEIDPAAATMFITWRETLSFVQRLGVGPGSSVLVIGSGANGLAFAAHAARLGATATAIGSRSRLELAQRAGAANALDYRGSDLSGRLATAAPDGFDYIIDAVGQTGQVDAVLHLLKPGGTVAIYGLDDFGSCAITPSRATSSFGVYNGGYDEAESHDAVVAAVRSGALDASLWLDLDRPIPLDDIDLAYRLARDRKVVKALIRVAG